MSDQIMQVAERIRGLRLILDVSTAEMARATDLSEAEYVALENGGSDFSFTFLFKCAQRLGVDIGELVTGDVPKLSYYTIVRKGKGMPIKRREGFEYRHLALLLKDRMAEPFVVTAPYKAEEQDKPIELSTHKGQEFDLVMEGRLKVCLGEHIEYLDEGDCVFYNSGIGHGMIATGGKDCVFLAVVLPEAPKDGE